MDRIELGTLLKEYGWYLSFQRQYLTRYAYAKKRVNGRMVSRYLVSERHLDQLTRERVLAVIGVQATDTGASEAA